MFRTSLRPSFYLAKSLNLTNNIHQSQHLTEEVSVSPEVVVLQVGIKVVDQQLLLLPFLGLSEIYRINGD